MSPPLPGFVVWFTGLPASGKSTLAREAQRELAQQGCNAVILDSDDLRVALTPTPTYSAEERDCFYSVVVYLAAWLARSGVNVLIAATGNRRRYRSQARSQIERFAEIYVRCDVDICRQRDPKGLFARLAAGQIAALPGAGEDYEPPEMPEVVVDTGRFSLKEATLAVMAGLRGFL